MSQVSSSFPSYGDEWDDGTNTTKYYDIDDHNAVYNVRRAGVGLYAGEPPEGQKRGRSRVSGEARSSGAKVSPRDVLRHSTKEAGKGEWWCSCAGDSRNDSCAGGSRNDSCTGESRNESRADCDSRNEHCVKDEFQRDNETFLDVRKDDVTFLDVRKDDETFPVLGSRSSFSLGSVVGTLEEQHVDSKLESNGETGHNMSETRVNSLETKHLMEIAIARCLRSHCVQSSRIEARRQKELDEGVEPEVVLDSFLNQVKVEQHPQSEPVKRVLTPAAKAAKHRRARDKKLRETLCWWIANDKVCPDGDRCNFKHAVTEEKEQTGASWLGPATEQNVSGTGVLLRGPSLIQEHPEDSTCHTGTIPGPSISTVIRPMSRKGIIVATDGHMVGTSTIMTTIGLTTPGASVKLVTSGARATGKQAGWCSRHWETSGWNKVDECSHNREGFQWLNHSFFETMNVDQLIDSLCKGDDDVSTFTGLDVDPGESLADTAVQSVVIDLLPFREAEEALFCKFGLKPGVIPGDNQAVGIGGKAKVLGKVVALPHGRRQCHSEVYRG